MGETLSHSYSPTVHAHLGTYSYSLFEVSPASLPEFLNAKEFDGLNVTIPYKKAVLPFLDALSPIAARLGSVNTIVRREDGTLFGHNTDYFGFSYMLSQSGVSVEGKKALVFGSGGASVTAAAVLSCKGAREVVVISRGGANNYENLSRHYDAEILVNTTPLGMYPNTGASPVTLSHFQKAALVLDIVYNPAKTALLLSAEALGIPCLGGLSMLVAQAKESAEYFTGEALSEGIIDDTLLALRRAQKNVILIGMPGSGKTTVGRRLAEKMGRRFIDADDEIRIEAGMSIPEIFEKEGEAGFRARETAVLEKLGKESGLVIATGGGAVTREENYPLLRQNGVLVHILRDIEALPKAGRPLSQNADLHKMYAVRAPLYAHFADAAVENSGDIETVTERVKKAYENSCN